MRELSRVIVSCVVLMILRRGEQGWGQCEVRWPQSLAPPGQTWSQTGFDLHPSSVAY